VLIAHTRKKGRIHRGGGRNFQAMQNDIVRFLSQESGGDVYFTTMIDLYALHKDFPDADEAAKLRNDPYKWVEALESSWVSTTSDCRFIPFIQLHEYEACLFADVTQLEFFYDNAQSSITTLQRIADDVASPELINDGQHTAPSKRITKEFPAYERSKTIVGPQVAKRIGLANIRTQCPHFDAWLKRLESLAADPPSAE
jgi:hypothetical protein